MRPCCLPSAGITKVGISYDKLCQSLKPGNIIKMADGSLAVEVLEILSEKELKGR
jgi:pyruvate kinase